MVAYGVVKLFMLDKKQILKITVLKIITSWRKKVMNREHQSILSSSIMASIRSNTKYLHALKSSIGMRATKGK